MYWPIGYEDREPIICDMFHDEGRIEPAFSCLGNFSDWLDLNNGSRGEKEIKDDEFCLVKLHKAKQAIKQNDPNQAIELLLQGTKQIPEISEFWRLLAGQYFRVNNLEAAVDASVRAYSATWSFGFAGMQVLQLLKRAAKCSVGSSDPVLKRVGKYDVNFGGHKENSNYPIMKDMIREYFIRDPILALQMNQNYAYMMQTETTAFQERYDYDSDRWRDEHAKLCQTHLGNDRQFSH